MAKTYIPTSVRKAQALSAYLARYSGQIDANIKDDCKAELAALVSALTAFVLCAWPYIKPDETSP